MKTVLHLDSLHSLGLMRTYTAFWILLKSIEKLVNNKADEVMNGCISSKECRNAYFQLLSSTLHNLRGIMSHFNHRLNVCFCADITSVLCCLSFAGFHSSSSSPILSINWWCASSLTGKRSTLSSTTQPHMHAMLIFN